MLKGVNSTSNVLTELKQVFLPIAKVFSDNKAMIDFVHGEGVAKGVRHMELRMWYVREQYQHGKVDVEYMPGVKIPSDKLTKLGNKKSHTEFMCDILGLRLLAGYQPIVYDSAEEEEDLVDAQ